MSAEVSAHTVTREISTRGAELWYWFKHYLILRWQMMLMLVFSCIQYIR